MCSAKRRHQSPEWMILGYVNCFIQREVIGFQVLLDSLHPRLVTSSAQASYELRVLRTRGLDDEALQHVYRATVVARLTYAASAWRGLAKKSDLQRIDSC